MRHDSVEVSFKSPGWTESALACLTNFSPIFGRWFHNNWKDYTDRYITEMLLNGDYGNDLNEQILYKCKELFKRFFQDIDQIPQGQYAEVAYQDLISDPLRELERIYFELNLAEFEENRLRVKNYLDTVKDFSLPNRYPPLENHIQRKICQVAEQTMMQWNYRADYST